MFYQCWLTVGLSVGISGLLYPFDSETRTSKTLDGIWNFVAERSNSDGVGFLERWDLTNFESRLDSVSMPVPSSYNDITESQLLRSHVGWVWYQREFFVPSSWASNRITLRFGSVNYFAAVFVNGENVMNHTGGHLPFECQVNNLINFNSANKLTVAVNNTLSHSTIPPGEFVYENGSNIPCYGYFEQTPDFDFFNYAGIQRSVMLYATANTYVHDIAVTTDIQDYTGLINYKLAIESIEDNYNVIASVLFKNGSKAESIQSAHGQLSVPNAILWWPIGMNDTVVAYLYTLQIELQINEATVDIYRLPIGIRTAVATDSQFLINGRPFYFKGVDTHEDSILNGRGYNPIVMLKDYNVMDWLNGNSYRSSHYPYSEERLYEADKRGFVVIGETPGVGLQYFTDDNLNLHKQMLEDMIGRDKNHPSIVMWSLANEPKSELPAAKQYFKQLAYTAQTIDSRPVTAVLNSNFARDQAAPYLDVICFNRYYGWYHSLGQLELIENQVKQEISDWANTYQKPIILSEYGAEAIVGLNTNPSDPFTENYQIEVMKKYHLAFDSRRQKGLIGELVWNLADFKTDKSISRVGSINHKGLFTRERQPKLSAYLIKQRYENIKC